MQTQDQAALGPLEPAARRLAAYELRKATAQYYRAQPIPAHHTNGDDERYAHRHHYASFTKGLPHDAHGEVDSSAYDTLLKALKSGEPGDFEAIPLGAPGNSVKLTDPQAGLAFDLEGVDPHQVTLPPAFTFRSEGEIGEIAELYWLALARDVAFDDYGSDPIAHAAAADLNTFNVFEGPRIGSAVTTQTLFRGTTPGDLAGPYLSQFLITDVPFGAQQTLAQLAFGLPEVDFMTNEPDYIAAQNGVKPTIVPGPLTPPRRFRKGRDLANYVHIDELFQAYLNACLILITPRARGGFGAPLASGNPYVASVTQVGFGTLGEPNFKTIVAEVATRALKAVWFQKWYVHRRLRPEAFAARIHWHLAHGRTYEFDPGEFAKLAAGVLAQPGIVAAGSFLPMAFPEGSPAHPSYGAGHATVAGACVTILKALFAEDVKLMDLGIAPMVTTATGALQPYTGSDAGSLTIGGELNKLASNIGFARNFAGVHWRSDFSASAKMGETIALDFLRDYVQTYNERVQFSVTRFDGTIATVQNS